MVPWIRSTLLMLILAVGQSACSLMAPHFEKPILTVASIELTGGNLLRQDFLLKFDVQNPNDRALPVSGLHAELNVLGERVASGVSNRAFVVPARGTTQFDMTISANLALALLKLAGRSDRQADTIDYDMTGAAHIDLPLIGDVPFHQSGSFSLSH